jgi:hypothetical protein
MKKTYIIQRSANHGVTATVLPEAGALYPLPHLLRHSPDGFEYGYGGSGPSDLARSLVGDLLGQKDPPPRFYRPVVEGLISQLHGSGPFYIAEDQIRQLLPVVIEEHDGGVVVQ